MSEGPRSREGTDGGPEGAATSRPFKESFSRASIRFETFPEGEAVVKDFGGRGFLFRRIVGPWLLDREERAYRDLEGIDGVPRVIARPSRPTLAIERIVGGVPVGAECRDRLDAQFFDRLDAAIRAMHARGVVHLDLHQKRNILVDPDGRPHVVDFASSLRLGRGIVRRRILLPILARLDRYAILKFKAKYAPTLTTPSERRALRRGRRLALLWPFRYTNEIKKRIGRSRRKHPR
jgi:hypothetical protein